MKIYTDGSYDVAREMGSWAYVTEAGESASGIIAYPEARNIDGEILAVIMAIDKYPEAQIFTDLQGIPRWVSKKWKANTLVSQNLQNFMTGRKNVITWVKGHSGNPTNEQVHKLASSILKSEEATKIYNRKKCRAQYSPEFNTLPDTFKKTIIGDVVQEAIANNIVFNFERPDYGITEFLADYGLEFMSGKTNFIGTKDMSVETQLIIVKKLVNALVL
jgi:ribonuclease HI